MRSAEGRGARNAGEGGARRGEGDSGEPGVARAARGRARGEGGAVVTERGEAKRMMRVRGEDGSGRARGEGGAVATTGALSRWEGGMGWWLGLSYKGGRGFFSCVRWVNCSCCAGVNLFFY